MRIIQLWIYKLAPRHCLAAKNVGCGDGHHPQEIIFADVIRFAFFIGTSLFRSWLLFLSQIFNFGSLIYIFITTDLRYFLGFSIFLGSGLLFSGALDLFYLFSLGCFLGLSIFLGSGLRLFRSNFIRDFGFRGDRSSITLCCTFRRLVFNICFCCKGQLI